MKTLLIILSFCITHLVASSELSWVDEQVQAIKPPRDGMHRSALSKIRDPFIFLKKNRGEEEKKESKKSPIEKDQKSGTKIVTSPTKDSFSGKFILNAIINQSAMINGVWYKLGSNVHGYIVRHISSHSVLLTKNSKSRLLTTKTLSKNIKFQK